jgi:glycyl-tRNA synthetase
MQENRENLMEKIVSLCKRRGFIFPGSEIYGGLAGTFDYGPLGVVLKKNIEESWWKHFVTNRTDMYGIDAAILMNAKAWEASGHVAGFSDPLVEDLETKKRYRADHLLEHIGHSATGLTLDELNSKIQSLVSAGMLETPEGGILRKIGNVRQFNMMFKTQIGATEDPTSISYLRPETAGGMFVNFKNVLDTFHPRLPFGLAQIGKAFRNEIAPRDFIFRLREMSQMEIEYFCNPRDWEKVFEELRREFTSWMTSIGLPAENIHEVEIGDGDRAHYSKRTIDFEFDFPIGQKELLGLAYRTDFDLRNHSTASGVDLSYFDEETKTRYIPHCIEPTFGLGRLMLAVLCDAYTEDTLGEETRVFLKLSPKVAPVKVAVFPLLKNKPALIEKARSVYSELKKEFGAVVFDDNGNIGKRYRRQDEIGTPYCVTVDFDTIEKDQKVTVRDRDTGKQERVTIEELHALLEKNIK